MQGQSIGRRSFVVSGARLPRVAWTGALLAATGAAQFPAGWSQATLPGSAPSPRRYHALVHDAGRGVNVLFGGSISIPDLADGQTWEWNGAAWSQPVISGQSPPARWAHGMAFDAARNVVVLFGGTVNDTRTWEYDGATATWTPHVTAVNPGERRVHAMVYDVGRGVTVLFGGQFRANVFYDDTWSWDGSVWARLPAATSPSPRAHHGMVFDRDRGVVVLFGGIDHTPLSLGDTWEWNGTWTLRAPAGPSSPPPSGANGMAYDPVGRVTVLFAGDTWSWNGTQWARVAVVDPPPRSSPAMTVDDTRQVVVLHGGGDPALFADTWTLRTSPASGAVYGTGCGAPEPTLAPRPGTRAVVGTTHTSDITNAFLGFAAVVWGFTSQSIPLAPVGIDGCTLWNGAEGELAAFCASTSTTTARHDFVLPFDAALVGAHVYLQAWTFAPGLNPLGIATSNGLDLVLGDV